MDQFDEIESRSNKLILELAEILKQLQSDIGNEKKAISFEQVKGIEESIATLKKKKIPVPEEFTSLKINLISKYELHQSRLKLYKNILDSFRGLITENTIDSLKSPRITHPKINKTTTKNDVIIKVSKTIPVSFHEACIARIESHLAVSLLKKSKSTYATPDNSTRLTCAVSKEYERGSQYGYWFAFHPHQKEFLSETNNGFVAFGCGDKNRLLLIPINDFLPYLDHMNITQKGDRFYWHVNITRNEEEFSLHLKKGDENINITKYLLN